MADPAIAVESLYKLFPAPQSGWRAFLQPFQPPSAVALDGVTFEVHAGESVAIVGANGTGKSTLLRILATLLLPTRGRARIAGLDVSHKPREARRIFGYHAGSDRGFYARLTGRENLRFFGRLQGLFGKEIEQRTERLAGHLGLAAGLDRQVRLLSTGTVQRLSLARALFHSPRVLLLDEPTRSLDALVGAEFRRYLRRDVIERGGATLLFASHTLAEVEQLADRVAILDAGKLLALETPAALRARTGAATLEEALFHLTGRRHPEISAAEEGT